MKQLALRIPRLNTSSPVRRGLTLIELMIAVTLTLIIVGIMVRAFKATSDQISIGRARMDMQNQLRMVTETLRADLQNATCDPRPRGVDDERTGYFEYIEGPEFDLDHFTPTTDSLIGDHDDVFALTVKSTDRPFRGRFNGGFVESYLAEVIWYVVPDGADNYNGNFKLYRRVLLIRPDLIALVPGDLILPPVPPLTENDFAAWFFEENDISARIDRSAGLMMKPNSLEDLANRQNRFAHNASLPLAGPAGSFPHELQNGYGAQANWLAERVLGFDSGDGIVDPRRLGEDLILNDCVGFDIKAYSPNAPAFVTRVSDGSAARPSPPYLPTTFTSIGQTIEFSDPSFSTFAFDDPSTPGPPDPRYDPAIFTVCYPQVGGYVDLGVNSSQPPPQMFTATGSDAWFLLASYPNELVPPRPYAWSANTWCTWWAGYEFDGIDQDDDGFVDEGKNGLDDDVPPANGVDDSGERETRPPYPNPLRSIQFSVRMVEKKTNQILQKSIKESFVPN